MSDFDRNVASARPYGADRAVAIDAGLRAYMIRVYNTMALGVALTGVVSWFTYQMPAVVRPTTPARPTHRPDSRSGRPCSTPITTIVLFLATLGFVFFISFRIQTLSVGTANVLFCVYAA